MSLVNPLDESFSSSSGSSSPTPTENICAGNGESVSCPKLQSETTQDVFESVVKGRKSWKLRGGEVVWPPELEAALLEGLENYKPDDSRETRLLGRFPMRNRFISDYIFQKTGKRRTAKQVGSRLQQLRDTCGGKRLLKLLSPIRRPTFAASRMSVLDLPGLCFDSASETSSEPATPVDSGFTDHFAKSDPPSRVTICIDILPEGISFSEELFHANDAHTAPDYVRASEKPRHIKNIDPTVTFLSRRQVAARSVFTVSLDEKVIHSETTPLTGRILPAGADTDGAFLYATALAPRFWRSITDSSDPTRFSISQDIYQDSTFPPPSVVYSAIYCFRYPSSVSPSASSTSSEPTFVADSTVPLTPSTDSSGPFLSTGHFSHNQLSSSSSLFSDAPKSSANQLASIHQPLYYSYDVNMSSISAMNTIQEAYSIPSSTGVSSDAASSSNYNQSPMNWRPEPSSSNYFSNDISSYVL